MIRIEHGDCLDVMNVLAMEGVKVHAVVTDPPYHLASTLKRFGSATAAPAKSNGATGVYARLSAGFMGQQWDSEIAMSPEVWQLCYELLVPGGFIVAFGGDRTYHRIACAIEDAGFEVRNMLAWLYGQGMPKRRGQLKPGLEPICLARKPVEGTVAENKAKYGTGELNTEACRIETDENLNGGAYAVGGGRKSLPGDERDAKGQGMFAPGKTVEREFVQPVGRWPANVAHDGSDEVLEHFPVTKSGKAAPGGHKRKKTMDDPARGTFMPIEYASDDAGDLYGDEGSAARFFYCAKAPKAERNGSKHPTVKPVAFMRWLTRLVTPPGGLILDPFAGTGTTLQAAREEGFSAIGIEQSADYIADIKRRLAAPVVVTPSRARPAQIDLEEWLA